jgi:hypothetical protein
MRRFTLLLLVALLGGTDRLAAQETVETRGITSEIKIEEVIFGHLTELNGKFKLRATELTFAPDGYVGVHHHIGPPEFDMLFPASSHSRREARRRSIKQATIFLKQATSHTPRRIRQNSRLAC